MPPPGAITARGYPRKVGSLLDRLNATIPVLAAPMSGGPTTPAMVTAAKRAGSFGFLAAGYKSASTLASQIQEVRRSTDMFGVNLFASNPLPVDDDQYREYAAVVDRDGQRYGLDLRSSTPREDDDEWADKIDLLVRDPVPVVSFTFGVPEPAVIEKLRRAGSLLVQTVTSASEAKIAVDAVVDVLAVQSHQAGGHSATFTPRSASPPIALVDLVASVRLLARLPIIAAGGLGDSASVKAVLAAGADAVMVGTHLLRAHESGASPTYKAALAERKDVATAVTRAFSGRPARGIRNAFIDRYEDMAPFGYPAIHYLTTPLRQAAAAAGDADLINLWAGTGHATVAEQPVADALAGLAAGL